MEFCTIGVCDGIAMNHAGMRYSLASREVIADSVEIMAMAHPFDGLVLIPNCDKIIPGMLMAALRLNIPAIVISGGPMLAGRVGKQPVDLVSVFEAVGAIQAGRMTEDELAGTGRSGLPGLWVVRRHVHRQLHELPHRGAGPGAARQRHHSRGERQPHSSGQSCRDANHGTGAQQHPAARHCYPRGLRKCHGRRHGPGLLHQHRPSCSGHCP